MRDVFRACVCCVTLLLPLCSFAQPQTMIDSLRKLLPHKTDTALVNIYVEIAKNHAYLAANPDSMLLYADKVVSLSQDLSYAKGLSVGHNLLGYVYNWQGDWEKSNQAYLQALEMARVQSDTRGKVAVLNNLGRNHFQHNQFQLALEYFLDALRVSETDSQVYRTHHLGILNNIAGVFSELKQPQQSKRYRLQALKGARKLDDQRLEIMAMINLVWDYRNLKQLDSAQYYANEVLDISRRQGLHDMLMRALTHKAIISLDEGKYELTLTHTQELFDEADLATDVFYLSGAYRNRAWALDSLQRKSEALNAAYQALPLAYQDGKAYSLVETHQLLYTLLKKNGQKAKALDHLEKYQHLKDSLYTLEKDQQINELQTRYETEKNQRTIETLAQKNQIQQLQLQRQRITLFSVIIGALLIAGLLYLYNRQRILSEQQKALEAEQRLLRTQMNPHFLFNALAAIQEYLLEHEAAQPSVMYLSKFAKLMRLILENSREAFIPLSQEIDTLQFYLELQKMRFRDGFEYEVEVDPAIDPETLLIPPMFAQPFIENALEHGLKPQKGSRKLLLSFRVKEEQLVLLVEDNGIGRSAARSQQAEASGTPSRALEITQNRLDLLKKAVKKNFALRISDLVDEAQHPVGTRVALHMPLMYV